MDSAPEYSPRWRCNEFKLAINMAGAISAGAYTAGVLDFLTEALDEWATAKKAFREQRAAPVPLHEVTIEAISGASAGGMCAAIAAVMLQKKFDHIHDAHPGDEIPPAPTTNTFYEAWVNQIDIRELLSTRDVDGDEPVVSLLDSTIIDDIALKTVAPPKSADLNRSDYVSKNLNLFLPVTNVRGVSYPLYGGNSHAATDLPPGVDEFIAYYGDHLQFETTEPHKEPVATTAKSLPLGCPNGAWDLLRETAKATGAVPVALAPRVLSRETRDYLQPPWPTHGEPMSRPLTPDFPDPRPAAIDTLNVDAGVTNNNPFDLAHDFLAALNPKRECPLGGKPRNPRDGHQANAAVLTIAPFPALDRFDREFDPAASSGISRIIARLFTVLLSQSRFLGESLDVLTSPNGFSRFVIAPSDSEFTGGSALQCGTLGAFGGFFSRRFRAHDFMLGRYNCQRFLKTQFALPAENEVFQEGLRRATEFAPEILKDFQFTTAPAGRHQGETWMPIIPCVGTAALNVSHPARQTLTREQLNEIVGLVLKRLRAIVPRLLDGTGPLSFLSVVALWPLSFFVSSAIRNYLSDALGQNLER